MYTHVYKWSDMYEWVQKKNQSIWGGKKQREEKNPKSWDIELLKGQEKEEEPAKDTEKECLMRLGEIKKYILEYFTK